MPFSDEVAMEIRIRAKEIETGIQPHSSTFAAQQTNDVGCFCAGEGTGPTENASVITENHAGLV